MNIHNERKPPNATVRGKRQSRDVKVLLARKSTSFIPENVSKKRTTSPLQRSDLKKVIYMKNYLQDRDKKNVKLTLEFTIEKKDKSSQVQRKQTASSIVKYRKNKSTVSTTNVSFKAFDHIFNNEFRDDLRNKTRGTRLPSEKHIKSRKCCMDGDHEPQHSAVYLREAEFKARDKNTVTTYPAQYKRIPVPSKATKQKRSNNKTDKTNLSATPKKSSNWLIWKRNKIPRDLDPPGKKKSGAFGIKLEKKRCFKIPSLNSSSCSDSKIVGIKKRIAKHPPAQSKDSDTLLGKQISIKKKKGFTVIFYGDICIIGKEVTLWKKLENPKPSKSKRPKKRSVSECECYITLNSMESRETKFLNVDEFKNPLLDQLYQYYSGSRQSEFGAKSRSLFNDQRNSMNYYTVHRIEAKSNTKTKVSCEKSKIRNANKNRDQSKYGLQQFKNHKRANQLMSFYNTEVSSFRKKPSFDHKIQSESSYKDSSNSFRKSDSQTDKDIKTLFISGKNPIDYKSESLVKDNSVANSNSGAVRRVSSSFFKWIINLTKSIENIERIAKSAFLPQQKAKNKRPLNVDIKKNKNNELNISVNHSKCNVSTNTFSPIYDEKNKAYCIRYRNASTSGSKIEPNVSRRRAAGKKLVDSHMKANTQSCHKTQTTWPKNITNSTLMLAKKFLKNFASRENSAISETTNTENINEYCTNETIHNNKNGHWQIKDVQILNRASKEQHTNFPEFSCLKKCNCADLPNQSSKFRRSKVNDSKRASIIKLKLKLKDAAVPSDIGYHETSCRPNEEKLHGAKRKHVRRKKKSKGHPKISVFTQKLKAKMKKYYIQMIKLPNNQNVMPNGCFGWQHLPNEDIKVTKMFKQVTQIALFGLACILCCPCLCLPLLVFELLRNILF